MLCYHKQCPFRANQLICGKEDKTSKLHNKTMRYRFNEFEFDSESLLLTVNGEALPIRHTEAKVLAVFLQQADIVLSKEDILSQVWQNKVVSEQVIFQNISHLRNLFGNNAIKTFPKRGYQWQLNTNVLSPDTLLASDNQQVKNTLDSSQQASTPMQVTKRNLWQGIVLAFFILILVGVFRSQSNVKQENSPPAIMDPKIKLAYIPIANLNETTFKNVTIKGKKYFDFTPLSHVDIEQFEDTIEIEYPKLSKTHPFILTGKIRSFKQQTYLDFMLKGPSSDWRGHLTGTSKEDVIEQMQQHLRQQVIYDVISHSQSPELRQAKLSIAHQESPNDLTILRKLSIMYLKNGELEKAMVMADKLISVAQSQNNSQHMGKALLYQSNLLRKKKLYDLSSQKLKLAIAQFEKIDDLKHLAHAWYIQSRLDHQQKDYPAIKTSLLKSAKLAYDAKDKLAELDALIYLSELAHHYQNDIDKYFYMQEAENKMNVYQLPIYHFAKIPFQHAIFAKTLSEKEPHLKQVLKFSVLTPEYNIAQSSRRQLMQHYIKENRYIDAQALVDSVTSDNYNNSYLKTLIAQAKQQTNKMISHAQRTFQQTQLAGKRMLSLDVALLLCGQQVNYDYYSQYIHDYATVSWRSKNKTKLLYLNL